MNPELRAFLALVLRAFPPGAYVENPRDGSMLTFVYRYVEVIDEARLAATYRVEGKGRTVSVVISLTDVETLRAGGQAPIGVAAIVMRELFNVALADINAASMN